MSKRERRAKGVYYTPEPIVRYITQGVLDACDAGAGIPTVLDPACGEGIFLSGAYEALRRRWPAASHRQVVSRLYGADIDTTALLRARSTLHDNSLQVVHGDALVDQELPGQDAPPIPWRKRFPEVFACGGFDAVIGNPPYVNVRRLARYQGTELRKWLGREFACASGCYDLYVLFIEQALRLLRPGGVCGLIVPNKIATLRYAQPCRDLLMQRTEMLRLVDVSQVKVFGEASVYPYILIFRKSEAAPGHCLTFRSVSSMAELERECKTRSVPQGGLGRESGWRLHGDLDVESRVSVQPLQACCRLASGATGFVAKRLADALVDGPPELGRDGRDFIVSGNIDRFHIRTGGVRFMGRRYQRPRLPLENEVLSAAKRELYRTPKIVLAGMSRRLEAAWDADGFALGVQVFAAHQFRLDPWYLLALLNSRLLSFLFRQRYQAKRLAGNYLAINLRQLAELPIPEVDRRRQMQLRQLVRRRLRVSRPKLQAEYERQIDRVVYGLYDLTDAERSVVDAALAEIGR